MIRPRISSGGSFYHLQSTRSRAEHERKQKHRRRSIPISIHTLCMGRDMPYYNKLYKLAAFQSTRPVWGVTPLSCISQILRTISIHTPRVGRDRPDHMSHCIRWIFQSTRPVWGVTVIERGVGKFIVFQSTRPVWGVTCRVSPAVAASCHFNPHAPCGA